MSDPITTERPFTIAISQAELIALVKWNAAQAKRVVKIFGQESLKVSATSIFPQGTKLATMKAVCLGELDKYTTRAKGLASLLK
ncbi:MAG: hypothetical protein NTZ16_12460 [Verrucomicrobia bacterium]|nr:hypothetical protein [Verrucomicrobiota bacterium]